MPEKLYYHRGSCFATTIVEANFMDGVGIKDNEIVVEGPPRVDAFLTHRVTKLNTEAQPF